MTVTYTAEVATCRGFGCFLTLLLRWRGSIYKLVWPDLAAFLTLYYSLSFTYRFALQPDQKKVFESISEYCDTYSNFIPLSFVLGFYISIIMQRWWSQYTTIPWPDPIAVFVSSNIHGQDERGRLMRRTIVRYVCLCLTMVFSMICPRVKKRFPTLEHFVAAGLMTESEKSVIIDLNSKFPQHSKHWLPIVWAASIVTRARKEGRIRDDFAVKTIIDELNIFRGKSGHLLQYDMISVPLVYTQVVTLATYSFFITSVIGRQWLDVDEKDPLFVRRRNPIDLYFPVFTTLQFFFYMGWLKVAESLINPFGEDDDDFEVNWIVDRNLSVSYLIVDEMHHEHPELIKDQYWDEVFPTELPHTIASEPFKEKIPQPSTANIAVQFANLSNANPSTIKIDELGMADDNQSGIHFSAEGRSSSRLSMHRPRTTSAGSTTSMNNMGSLPRVNSVTSTLKRIFSRENTPATVDGSYPPSGLRLAESQSQTSLTGKYFGGGGGSMRIANQVIEEVDEQATITSMASKKPEVRPTARSLFENSEPIPVPQWRHSVGITSAPVTSSVPPASRGTSVQSVPSSACITGDTLSMTSSTGGDEDEFTRLKEERRRERERIQLARSISVIADGRLSPDEDIALLDITTDSNAPLIPTAPPIPNQ